MAKASQPKGPSHGRRQTFTLAHNPWGRSAKHQCTELNALALFLLHGSQNEPFRFGTFAALTFKLLAESDCAFSVHSSTLDAGEHMPNPASEATLAFEHNSPAPQMKFRMSVCVQMYRLASWYEKLGREGLRCPAVQLDLQFRETVMTNEEMDGELWNSGLTLLGNEDRSQMVDNGPSFPAYVMCEKEREEFSCRAVETRQRAHKFTTEWLGPDKIEIVERLAMDRDDATRLQEAPPLVLLPPGSSTNAWKVRASLYTAPTDLRMPCPAIY